MLTDAHCHLHEFEEDEIDKISGLRILVAAVSEDIESSEKTMRLAEGKSWVLPFVGVHPWNAGEAADADLQRLEKLAADAAGLGEIGLDRRYHVEEYARQREVFFFQLRAAREYGKPVNLHCLDAWAECLEAVLRHDVPSAVFHWYNGPASLVEEIASYGYYVSVNAAIKIQEKHRRIAAIVPRRRLLVESDGPYNYRGIRLAPWMIPETLEIIASIRGEKKSDLEDAVYSNFVSAFMSLK